MAHDSTDADDHPDMELLVDLVLDLLGDLVQIPGLSPIIELLDEAHSLMESTKSTCLSGNRAWTTSMRAGSVVST